MRLSPPEQLLLVSEDGLKLSVWWSALNNYETGQKMYQYTIADLPVGSEEWMVACVEWDTTQGTIIKLLMAGIKLAKMRSKNQQWIG